MPRSLFTKKRLVCWLVTAALAVTSACGVKDDREVLPPDVSEGFYHHSFLNHSLIDMLYQVRSDIMAAARVRADFLIIEDPAPNAFMTVIENQPAIILTTGIIELLGDARDEYAFLIAHECAHLSEDHLGDRRKKESAIDTAGSAILTGIELLGMAFGVPLGIVTMPSVESGTHLAALKYDRDQEREADRLAVSYMKAAGYDPRGAVSFHEKMFRISRGPALPILSTHPADEERLETIRALVGGGEFASPADAGEARKEGKGER